MTSPALQETYDILCKNKATQWWRDIEKEVKQGQLHVKTHYYEAGRHVATVSKIIKQIDKE